MGAQIKLRRKNMENIKNQYPSTEEVKEIREMYPKGTKVVLDNMDDTQAPASGTLGEVELVDDIGQIHVAWENGSSLALILGVDKFHVQEEEKENTYDVFSLDCYLDESGWVVNDQCHVGTISLPASLMNNQEEEKKAILTALTQLEICDVTGMRTQKALATTDPNLVAVEDYYGDGSWYEVVSVRAGNMPVYGVEFGLQNL
jgi:hypothetical protein